MDIAQADGRVAKATTEQIIPDSYSGIAAAVDTRIAQAEAEHGIRTVRTAEELASACASTTPLVVIWDNERIVKPSDLSIADGVTLLPMYPDRVSQLAPSAPIIRNAKPRGLAAFRWDDGEKSKVFGQEAGVWSNAYKYRYLQSAGIPVGYAFFADPVNAETGAASTVALKAQDIATLYWEGWEPMVHCWGYHSYGELPNNTPQTMADINRHLRESREWAESLTAKDTAGSDIPVGLRVRGHAIPGAWEGDPRCETDASRNGSYSLVARNTYEYVQGFNDSQLSRYDDPFVLIDTGADEAKITAALEYLAAGGRVTFLFHSIDATNAEWIDSIIAARDAGDFDFVAPNRLYDTVFAGTAADETWLDFAGFDAGSLLAAEDANKTAYYNAAGTAATAAIGAHISVAKTSGAGTAEIAADAGKNWLKLVSPATDNADAVTVGLYLKDLRPQTQYVLKISANATVGSSKLGIWRDGLAKNGSTAYNWLRWKMGTEGWSKQFETWTGAKTIYVPFSTSHDGAAYIGMIHGETGAANSTTLITDIRIL